MDNQPLKHHFFVIMGPSGSGKTRVTEAVFPSEYKVVSHTTRKIREGERDGVDYYFETPQEFEKLIQNDALVEYDFYHGNYYGVGKAAIFEKTNDHCAYDVLTFKGFQQIEKFFGSKIIPIFFDVSKEKVTSRLNIRESNPVTIEQRLKLYDEEILVKNQVTSYPNSVIINANEDFDQVVASLRQIVKNIDIIP